MPEARLEITVGSTKFAGEGSETWLSAELEKFLSELPNLSALPPSLTEPEVTGAASVPGQKPTVTLPTYLQDTQSTANQVRKFIATAIWLQDKNGGVEIRAADVAKALRDSMQAKLANPSDALNKNVEKGYCEKTVSGFFVTSEGRASLKS